MATDTPVFHDLIIVGAGLYGIQAARTYLDIHPEKDVVVFESSPAIGGVWGTHRVYDAFQTQTPVRIAEFSDRRLDSVPPEECYFDFFPARYLTAYLEEYVDSHVYSGRTLRERCDLNSRVEKVEKVDGLWRVSIQGSPWGHQSPKIMDCSGLTSDPNMPRIPGMQDFQGLQLHQKAFGTSDVLTNESVRSVIVLGGTKSAADIAYASAKAGKQVAWVIRKSGAGPCAFVPAMGSMGYKNSNDWTYTRYFANYLASIFTPPSWIAQQLYHSPLGRWAHRRFWEGINQSAVDLAGFNRPDRQENGFQHLKPDTSVFWQNDSTGVNQRADFFDVISSGVTIYREDVKRLTATHLETEHHSIACDALMFATGWRSNHSFYDADLIQKLGLPTPLSDGPSPADDHWTEKDAKADAEALQRFPLLAHPPDYFHRSETTSPFRLYKTILPLEDQSIAFLGKTMLGNNFLNAEVQALWATAALDGQMRLPPRADMELDISRVVAWCRRRYLAKGALGNWFYFDAVPYTDMLLNDLGLGTHRKRPWLRDFWDPCYAKDLKDLIPEYIHRRRLAGAL